jgi:hypothetical protein
MLRKAGAFLKEWLWREANLSWTTATPHTSQAAATTEALAHDVVHSDPVLPHTGEMTFRQPIVRIPGTGCRGTGRFRSPIPQDRRRSENRFLGTHRGR